MYEYIVRTADCVDSHFFLTELWKARAVAPTVGCLTRETRGSEKMIGEILCRKWGDLRPSLVSKADLSENKNKSFLSWLQTQQASITHLPGSPKMLGEGDYAIFHLICIDLINQNSPPAASRLTLAYTV